MAIKANVGKLEFDPTVMQDLPKMEVDLIPGDQKSLKRYQIFDEKNKDPFDNFLIAVSLAHNLTLLTSDDKILQLQVKGLKLQDACS